MRFKQSIFVIVVILITMGCFYFMSVKYHPLSRYKYEDPQAKELIRRYLNREEIEYIITWSIQPSDFIDYIEAPQFNIYRSALYRQVHSVAYSLSTSDVVSLTENALKVIDEPTLFRYLNQYYAHILVTWFKDFDPYQDTSTLILNPGDILAYVDNNNTVFQQIPNYLYEVDPKNTYGDKVIQLSYETQEGLNGLCEAISQDLKISRCGGLRVLSGFRTYDEEVAIYEAKLAQGYSIEDLDYPGHSEHQLGLAIDLGVAGVKDENFTSTKQYSWLLDNAHHFGFVQTYTENSKVYTEKNPREAHFRFAGVRKATKMVEDNLALKEVID